jgi:hypothetical protein
LAEAKDGKDDLPASLFPVFRTSGLFSIPVSKVRAGKWLVDLGHLQEEGVIATIATDEFAVPFLQKNTPILK